LSVESDDAGFRRKLYNFAVGGVVAPACPGCGSATEGAAARPHECAAASTTFNTALASCPFCEEPLGDAALQQDTEFGGINFPLSAEDCLKHAAGRESRIVRYDPLKGIFVKDPDGRGQFILVHDWGVPGGVLYLLPRVTYFQTSVDFYNHYEQLYECARPAAGGVWVVSPAIVRKVAGGWKLLEKGELEIKDGAPQASRLEQPRKKKKSDARPAAARTTTRQEPSNARHVAEAKAQPPAQTVTCETHVQTPTPQTEAPQIQPTQTQPTQTQPPKTELPHVTTPRPRGGDRRALTIALGALVALVGVGLFIVAIAARRSSNTNLDSNARTAPASTVEVTNSYSPSNPPPGMIYVPGGDFLMGSGADAYERPEHEASVGPFFIDTYEVTCGEYAKFAGATGHATPSSWGGKTCPVGWERLPVTGVNWDDAQAYASWAGKRLPTEAEWEFAARGNDGRKYPWGSDWEAAAANVKSKGGQLAEVGTYRSPSPFGVYDMSGNAWEWTATDFAPYPGGDASLAKKQRSGKVIRGGCYASKTEQATTTYRGVWPPQGENYDRTGFRCVMDVP
jgi:formylglycine-generating enzyme required for sulfatase activity